MCTCLDASENDDVYRTRPGNEFSGEEDDGPSIGLERVPIMAKKKMDLEDFSFQVLIAEEIPEYMKNTVQEVSDVIQIPIAMTRILLYHFKWDKDKLYERYYDGDQEQLFKEAHLVSPFEQRAGSKPHEKPSEPEAHAMEQCEICARELPSSMMTGLACHHRFCRQCWNSYITTKIIGEGICHTISCAAPNCDILVDDYTVMQLLEDAKVKLKYQHLITNSFVDINRLLRWCPQPDCKNVIKVQCVNMQPVTCSCSHTFCFSCGENWHEPVKCRLLKKWLKKCNDQSETSNWIAANTKACPKCNIAIQKDGGCNQMICINENCNADFCWVCLGPWESHGTLWFDCNRYDEEEAKAARDAQERFRASHERYLFCHNRYLNHMQSLEFNRRRLHALVKKTLEGRQLPGKPWIWLQFFKKGLEVLCQCKHTLMYTYVFSFYLSRNNQSLIFEDNQKDLESTTENLLQLLEEYITTEMQVETKQLMQDMYRYCENRRRVLVEHVHEGYEKDGWKYTE